MLSCCTVRYDTGGGQFFSAGGGLTEREGNIFYGRWRNENGSESEKRSERVSKLEGRDGTVSEV